MPSNPQNPQSDDRGSATSAANPSDLFLSLATVPVLVALAGSRAITKALLELSQASEEIFRGDRLPTLNVPMTSVEQSEPSQE